MFKPQTQVGSQGSLKARSSKSQIDPGTSVVCRSGFPLSFKTVDVAKTSQRESHDRLELPAMRLCRNSFGHELQYMSGIQSATWKTLACNEQAGCCDWLDWSVEVSVREVAAV